MKKYKIITVLSILILSGCLTKSDVSLKSESRGNTMKKYLHYCTYEIWDGFREDIRYNFVVVNDINYIDILLYEQPKTDKLDELIDIDILKHKVELKEKREDKYFGEVNRKKIKVGDYPAVLVSYEINQVCKKGESDFKDYLRIIENCFIKLKDKTVVIKGNSFFGRFEPIKPLWEEFFMSYKPDQSQKLKTNYGSFKWVDGLQDKSIIKYNAVSPIPEELYTIEFTYLDSKGKDESDHRISSLNGTVDVYRGTLNVSNVKNETISRDGYKIQYDEKYASDDTAKVKMAFIRIFDFTPGINISITESKEGSFDKYRNELNAMIQSIKFYPDLKRD